MKKIRKITKNFPTLGENVNLRNKKHLGLILFLVFYNLLFLYILYTAKTSVTSSAAETKPPEANRFSYDQMVKAGNIKPVGKILQINLVYNATGSPTLAVSKIEKKNGYVPQQVPVNNGYKLDILNKNNTVLYTQNFLIPNKIEGPPPLPGEKAGEDSKVLSYVEFALNTPYYQDATIIKVYNPTGTLVVTSKVTTLIESIENKPDFETVPGKEFKKPRLQGFLQKLQNFFFQPTNAQGNNNYLDIAIISDGYGDMAAFHRDADEIVNYLLTYEPFRSRASQILFHYVDNTTSLGCYFSGRMIICNDQIVVQQVNNAAAPSDSIYVLVNTSTYGGSGGNIGTGYNGPYKGPMFVHELAGHTFGRLRDEYVENGIGPIDNKTHGIWNYTDGNCYAGTPPAADWQGIVSSQEYFAGCDYTNWYRSSSTSIMKSFGENPLIFNPVSQRILNKRLDIVAGAFTGPTPTFIPTPTPSPTPSGPQFQEGYTYCAKEGEICSFPGLAQVAFVAFTSSGGRVYQLRYSQNSVSCSTSVFGIFNIGDPKYCFYKLLVSTPTPTPTPTPTLNPTLDSDRDGYSNAVEIYIGTNPNKACITDALNEIEASKSGRPSKTWPADLNTMAGALPSFNKLNILDITSFTVPVRIFNTKVGDALYDKRYDLNADGKVDLIDLTNVSIIAPPMLNNVRAFNGPPCPIP